jgi:hypothetical protein
VASSLDDQRTFRKGTLRMSSLWNTLDALQRLHNALSEPNSLQRNNLPTTPMGSLFGTPNRPMGGGYPADRTIAGEQIQHRSAVTGWYVTEEVAKRDPDRHVRETMPARAPGAHYSLKWLDSHGASTSDMGEVYTFVLSCDAPGKLGVGSVSFAGRDAAAFFARWSALVKRAPRCPEQQILAQLWKTFRH